MNQPLTPLKACPTCKAPVFLRDDKKIVAHYGPGYRKCPASETMFAEVTMKCKHCDLPVVSSPMPGLGKRPGVYWAHDYGNGVRMIYDVRQTHYAEPREPASYLLYIYLHQTRAWERHESATVEVRDCLRAIWRNAGHATAVVR